MGDTPADLPVPYFSADARAYWRAAKEGRLVMQKCDGCGAYRFFPSFVCSNCGSDETVWGRCSGRGTIYSLTVVHRAPSPAFRAIVPYVVALIDLEEGPRMMANIVGDDRLDAAIGDLVEVCFEARGPEFKVPQFARVGLNDAAQ
ncbi:MAG: Zn-ribbon domain-containing OB-fold protein [Pseudomonadota bacterium]